MTPEAASVCLLVLSIPVFFAAWVTGDLSYTRLSEAQQAVRKKFSVGLLWLGAACATPALFHLWRIVIFG